MANVTITVSGPVGSGKSALCKEIEILCRALGVPCVWEGGREECNLVGGDSYNELAMYQPCVTLREVLAAAHVPSEWQPIETAPSLCRILICGGTVSWDDSPERDFSGVCLAESSEDGWRSSFGTDDFLYHKPTHWQPLPPPPIAAAQGESNE